VNILVTGGSGFVGRAVVQALRRAGHEVTVLTRQPASGLVQNGIRMVRGDLTSAETVADLIDVHGPAAICHLAGLTGIRDSFTRPTAYFDVNVGGTVNLLKAVRARHARTDVPTRIVFASSRAVYVNTDDAPIPETHPAVPTTPYGITKRVVEQLLGFESPSGALGATTLRCFNVAGGAPGIVDADAQRLIPRLVGALARKLPPVQLSLPGNRRDFVHVMDVGRAFVAAIDHVQPGTSRIYNVGTGTSTSYGEVVALLEQVAGQAIPRQAVSAAGAPDTDAGTADISLIHRDLGWAPTLTIEAIVRDAWHFAQAGSSERNDPWHG
jgi:UDP-glucose 4-epimerase